MLNTDEHIERRSINFHRHTSSSTSNLGINP